MIGVISATLTWITRDEIIEMRDNAASPGPFPSGVVPDLNLVGLCDSGWIFSQDLWFALAAFLFFGGTILVFYTSLGGFVQIAGFVTYYKAFDASEAAVISGMPSGAGPKLALISMLLVMVGLLFPLFIWSKAKLKRIWRRFLTITAEKDVQQTVPLVYAAAGSALLLGGMAVGSSSVYEEGTLSETLFVLGGLILLGAAMMALILPWKTE